MSLPAPAQAPDPLESGDLPGVALCAVCGSAECSGHDFEQSGERPIHRVLPWEEPGPAAVERVFSTAMATADDVDLWARASRSSDGSVGAAFGFALLCEVGAVLSAFGPLVLLGAIATWLLTSNPTLVLAVIRVGARLGTAFVPLMLITHVGHVWSVSRVGNELGRPVPRRAVLRAGLYECGWDMATGPLGVLYPLIRGQFGLARRRMAGNRELFRRGAAAWLRIAHGVENDRGVRRASWLPVLVLLALSGLAVAWAVRG